MLTRDELLGSFTRRYYLVQTAAGQLRIQNLTEAETADFQAGQLNPDGKINETYQRTRRQRLVAACLVDEAGGRLLNQPGDMARLANVDGAVITAVFGAALKHCGFADQDDAETLTKNSEPAPAGALPIG